MAFSSRGSVFTDRFGSPSEPHKKRMSVDDPRTYQAYDEDLGIAAVRLDQAVNIERLQDEMRRVKKTVSFQALADLIPKTIAQFAPRYPTGGDLSSQNLYDFLKLKSPSIPGPKRRLAFHAFMMVVDEAYREKWNYTHFVRRAGLALTDFFATTRGSSRYQHAAALQRSAGLYAYRLDPETNPATSKHGFRWRCLLLVAPRDLPFLLAYDFDIIASPDAAAPDPAMFTQQPTGLMRDSWNLDARVGFFIPKRSDQEGIILLNSFKWDWPTIYASILNYQPEPLTDYHAPEVVHILLTDVNSFVNIERTEKTYLSSDYEIPDERKLMAIRQSSPPEYLTRLSSLLERKFDWGADL